MDYITNTIKLPFPFKGRRWIQVSDTAFLQVHVWAKNWDYENRPLNRG